MIRLEIWEYSVRGYPNICGRPRQSQLDACRQLRSMGGLTDHCPGVFRNGSGVADISGVERAELTISKPSEVSFVKYRVPDAGFLPEAA
jgi:hypothetical protein